MTRAQLTAWIATLRTRLDRGELANLPPVQLQPWYHPTEAEAVVRGLLEEVDEWQARLPEQRQGPAALTIQQRIAEDLSALYERLVEGKPCPGPTWRQV